MRPTLAALTEQQEIITGLRKTVKAQGSKITAQNEQIGKLTRGLDALAQSAGGEVYRKVASAMLHTADAQNPGQPVPEPPAQPAPESGVDAKTPEAFADVSAPGMVPGTTNDVAADATTTAYTPGMDIAAPAFHQLVDVTAPVDGTQNPRPLEETKTLTDVRVGDPMRPDVAFPLRGDFANAQRTSSRQEDVGRRTMASIRLARLQIAAGLGEGDDLALGTQIEKDASRSLTSIEQEIATLDKVRVAASRRRVSQNPRLVPRTASAGPRPTLSLQTQAVSQSGAAEEDNSDLFD
jgi:hypothetical protein